MRSALAFSVALTACYQPAHDAACTVSCSATAACPGTLQCGGDQLCHEANGSDCTRASAVDAPPLDSPMCYGTQLQVRVCASPAQPITLAGAISTDTDCTFTLPQENANAAMLCVIAGTSITVSGSVSVSVRGSRPLLLFATDTITVDAGATLDVASRRNVKTGPGASTCTGGIAGQGNATYGGGGGGGGPFQGAGGGGGNGASKAAISTNGGATALPMTLLSVTGGCAGAPGGGDSANAGAGTGGSSGGAVYLLAGNVISVSGAINASGASGGRATPMFSAGGGGGGAGGLVVLDAPTITVSGTILASGGGGGGGAANDSATNSDGCEPSISQPLQRACGGTGATPAGGGGLGTGISNTPALVIDGAAGINSGVDGTNVGGGGGGGGGAGHILVSTPPLASGTIMPPAG